MVTIADQFSSPTYASLALMVSIKRGVRLNKQMYVCAMEGPAR